MLEIAVGSGRRRSIVSIKRRRRIKCWYCWRCSRVEDTDISLPIHAPCCAARLRHQFASTPRETWTDYSRSKAKRSPYTITEHRVPELIPVLCSQPAGDVSHKPSGRLSLLSARPAVTRATLQRAATNFAAWWTEAQWVRTVCLRLLPDSVAAAILTQALLHLSPAR